MELRFRLVLLSLVGLIALAVWTFPVWRQYLRQRGEDAPFPGLALELQDEFLALPRAQREWLLERHDQNANQALEMALAAIEPDQPAPPEDLADQLAGAQSIVSGEFQEIDALHNGAGLAVIYELADGRRILRFEDFVSQRCRDMRVYLALDPLPLSALQLEAGSLDLGRLKGNIGNQYYFLPGDHDLSVYQSAVIFCRQFNTVLTAARLQ